MYVPVNNLKHLFLLGEALSDEKHLFVCLYGDRVV